MITSIQQRNLVVQRMEALQRRLETPPKAGVSPHMVAAEESQVAGELAELAAELGEFDRACQTELETYTCDTYEAFLKFPIVVRLARGMSQQEFAQAVDISLSQLKRYEAQAYRNAPSHVVDQVLRRFKLQYSARISQAG